MNDLKWNFIIVRSKYSKGFKRYPSVIKKQLLLKRKRRLFCTRLFLNAFVWPLALLAPSADGQTVNYVNPLPGSRFNHPSTAIVVRFDALSKQAGIPAINIRAGNKSTPCRISLADDGRTVIATPIQPFAGGSTIRVSVSTEPAYSFEFMIQDQPADHPPGAPMIFPGSDNPDSLIEVDATVSGKLAPGFIFMAPRPVSTGTVFQNMILDEHGRLVHYRSEQYSTNDFKPLTDSTFCYYGQTCFYILDRNLQIIDSVRAGNGHSTSPQEIEWDAATGHYFIFATQQAIVNMTDSVPGGYPFALVIGQTVQEIDRNHNVVFEWKTLDHLPVTDADGVNLQANIIDYAHCNSIDIDSDSTLLISVRHLNEIDRINRRTGELMWRLGRNSKGNQFTFTNDTGFSYQHDAKRLSNGHILLFDNGNLRPGPRYSRAVEYQVNEVSKTATRVWQYRNQPDYISSINGSVQRLANGGTFICWGNASVAITEVDSANIPVLGVTLPVGLFTDRAYKKANQAIASHQLNVLLPDSFHFCNETEDDVLTNLDKRITPGLTVDHEFYANDYGITLECMAPGGYYSYSTTQLDFGYAGIDYSDTTFCKGQPFTIKIASTCRNPQYYWSNGDTLPFFTPSQDSSGRYWVDITGTGGTRRDYARINVLHIDTFGIIGRKVITDDYQIDTYSVPFDSALTYAWSVVNGNVVGSPAPNAINVQWGDADSGYIRVDARNRYGCVYSASKNIAILENSSAQDVGAVLSCSIFPNPVTDALTIQAAVPLRYLLYDLTGRLLTSGETKPGRDIVRLPEITPGIYSLVCTGGGGSMQFKLNKQQP